MFDKLWLGMEIVRALIALDVLCDGGKVKIVVTEWAAAGIGVDIITLDTLALSTRVRLIPSSRSVERDTWDPSTQSWF